MALFSSVKFWELFQLILQNLDIAASRHFQYYRLGTVSSMMSSTLSFSQLNHFPFACGKALRHWMHLHLSTLH